MYWMVPTHSLICGDVDGNIALQVTGLTPDRDGWNGRLPVPGTGDYEWRGFRTDLPRELRPVRRPRRARIRTAAARCDRVVRQKGL